jgi:hypothetical protein
VDLKFQTFYGRIGLTFNNGRIEGSVDLMYGINQIKAKDKCPYQITFHIKPKLPKSLKIFGEMGVVIAKDDIQGKLKNRGSTCMFVRYSVEHTNDVYQMLNLNTKTIIQKGDVV